MVEHSDMPTEEFTVPAQVPVDSEMLGSPGGGDDDSGRVVDPPTWKDRVLSTWGIVAIVSALVVAAGVGWVVVANSGGDDSTAAAQASSFDTKFDDSGGVQAKTVDLPSPVQPTSRPALAPATPPPPPPVEPSPTSWRPSVPPVDNGSGSYTGQATRGNSLYCFFNGHQFGHRETITVDQAKQMGIKFPLHAGDCLTKHIAAAPVWH